MRDAVRVEICGPGVAFHMTNSTKKKLIHDDNRRASKHIRLRGPRDMPTHKLRVAGNGDRVIVAQSNSVYAPDACMWWWCMTEKL